MLVYQEGIRVLLTLLEARVQGMVLQLCQEILDIVVKQAVMSEIVLIALRKEVELDRKIANRKIAQSTSNILSDYQLKKLSHSNSLAPEKYENNTSLDNHAKTLSNNGHNSSEDDDNGSNIDECDEELESSDADIPMQEEIPNNFDIKNI